MKKFFTILSSLLLAMALPAQDLQWDLYGIQPDQPLVSSADQLSSPYSDEAEGLHIEYLTDGDINTFWHSDWHGRVSGTPYLEIELAEETEGYMALCIGRRNSSSTCQFTNMEVQTSADGTEWKSMGTSEMPYLSLNEYVVSTPFYMPEGTSRIRVYCVGRSNTVNVINDCGVGTFHMAEFQMYRVNDNFGKEFDLNSILLKYDEYIGGESNLNMGEGFGQYNDYEAEQAFLKGLHTASEILANEQLDAYTNAQIREIIRGVEESYAAVLASEVPFRLAVDGYYRILCNMNYVEEQETGDIDLDGNPIVEQTVVPKAVYATIDSKACWGTRNDTDCRFLWRLEQKEGGISMVNAATGEHMYATDSDNKVVMTAEGDTLMAFDYVASQDGHDILYIRFSGAEKDMSGNLGSYLHQLSHQQGKGKGDALCLWVATWNKTNGDKGTSEFYLESVSDEEAEKLMEDFATIKDHDKMVLKYQETIGKSKTALEIAKDMKGAYTPSTDQPLITSAGQFSSLWSDPSEGTSFEPLVDTDASTFWHSTWHGSDLNYPTHSFEVAMPEGATGWVKAYIQRRQGAGDDHITLMKVYGCNDEAQLIDPSENGWTLVSANLTTPWFSGQADAYTEAFFLDQPYKYLRFYVTGTLGAGSANRTFFHMGGFQIYPAEKTGNTQYDHMAEAGDRLQGIVDAYPGMDMETLTVEQYNELMAAYEAFGAKVVDPAPLRNAIDANRNAADVIELGTNPGYWADMTSADNLAAVIARAEAYDKSARLTVQESEQYIAQIQEAAAAIMTSVIPVSPDKWYRLRFATMEQYEKYGWNPVNAHKETVSLLGKVIVPSRFVEATESQPAGVEIYPQEDIREGNTLHYVDPEMLTDDSYAMFRFVPLEDGSYAVQHKLSGLYMQRDRYHDNKIRVQVQPTKMTVKPLGKGQVAFVMEDLAGFTWEQHYMNAWCDHLELMSWTPESAGSNSGLFIEEVADITGEEDAPYYYKDVAQGGVYGMCYPVPMAVQDGIMYTVVGTYEESGAQFLALREIEQAAAGEPFIFVAEGDYNAENAAVAGVQLGAQVATEPLTVNGLTGHFVPAFLDGGHVLFQDGKAKVMEGNNVNVVSNEAYLIYGTNMVSPDVDYDLAIQLDGRVADSIKETVEKVSAKGSIYSLSGRLVKQNGTLGDMNSLAPGIYILNGVKVLVK